MFTGIIESLAEVVDIEVIGNNKNFTLRSSITGELQVDQSVSHNGVCLTVTHIEGDLYTVSAIEETLSKSNLQELKIGDSVNLERSVTLQRRMDGHMVQGHVDAVAKCVDIKNRDGSWIFRFSVGEEHDSLMVEKGSICVNGTSLTLFDVEDGKFSVAIIPYTYAHTSFHHIIVGDLVNIEFDILGKYIIKYLKNHYDKK